MSRKVTLTPGKNCLQFGLGKIMFRLTKPIMAAFGHWRLLVNRPYFHSQHAVSPRAYAKPVTMCRISSRSGNVPGT